MSGRHEIGPDPVSGVLQPPIRAGIWALGALPRSLQRRLAGAPLEIDGQVLEPEIQLSLRLLEPLGIEEFDLRPVPAAREQIELEARLYRGRSLPVREVSELEIDGAGGPLRTRLYSVPDAESALLVYLHGGGWVVGSLESHDQTCRFLAREAGVRVLSIDYRLAPEHRFPAAADDAVAAVRWAIENAADLGVDPGRVAVGGDSAGGNLATAAAHETAADARPPAMQALIYPVCDLSHKRRSYQLFGEGFFLTDRQMDWYRGHYLADEAARSDPRASPLLAGELAGSPPTYIAVAGFDPLRDEGIEYARRLRDADVDVDLRLHRGLIHGFANAVGVSRASAAAMRELAAALRAGLVPA